MFLFCLVFAMFCARLFICALWSPAGKRLTSWLWFVMSTVSLSLSHWYPGEGVVLCVLTYFLWRYFAFPYFVCQEPTRILYLIFYILKLLNYLTYFTGVFTFDWLQRAYNMITFLQVILIGKLRISVW